MIKCPYCNKEVDEIETTYEIADGDGTMLDEDIASTLTDILDGKTEFNEYHTIYCPHCKETIDISYKYKVYDVKVETSN